MISVRSILSLRTLWNNKARTALVVLSIAVGVFAVGTIANSWVVLLGDLNTAYMATNPASAVLAVEPFDDDLVSAVEGTRTIAQAEGRRDVVVKMLTAEGRLVNLNLEAVDDFRSFQISRFTPESGPWPPARRELLVERSYAADLGLVEGQPVAIEMPDGQQYQLVYRGRVHDLHRPSAGNSEVAFGYVSFDTMQYLGEPRLYTSLYVTVAENPLDEAHIQQVVAELKTQTIERSGYTVLSTSIPTPGEAFLTVIINALLVVLAVVGAFSLLLSAGLVVNTVSAVVTQQLRQIGVMKAIGGVRRQIMQVYLSAVLLYGVLSLGIAIPLAIAGTRAFTGLFARIGNFDITTTGVPAGVIALEVAVGLLTPVLAALVPILFGTRITVREAITSYGIGTDMTSPTVIDRLMTRVRGLPGSLALSLRNTFRRKSRLALTLGTLTMAGAIFIGVLSVRSSLFASFERALVYYQYDLSVEMGRAYRIQQLEREASRVAGVVAVEGWLQRGATRVRADESESGNYALLGVPPASQFLDPEIVAGRWLRPGDQNAIVVNTDFLREEPDIRLGDTITLKIGGEENDWTIVGVVTKQYSAALVYVGIDDLGRRTGEVGLANRALIRLAERDPALQDRVAADLEERFKNAGLLVGSTTTRSEFVETFEMRFNFLILFLVLLAIMLGFVGGMGLAGTMGLNVLERIREIGVMRAIGASDRAVRRIILTEGIFIGLMSWLLGAVLSLPLAFLLATGVGFAFGGEALTFSFSLFGTGLWLVLAVGIAALSSYLPARRASRLTVREILAYE